MIITESYEINIFNLILETSSCMLSTCGRLTWLVWLCVHNVNHGIYIFKKEEESIRRHLNHVSYIDVGETGTRPRSNVRQSEQRKSPGTL